MTQCGWGLQHSREPSAWPLAGESSSVGAEAEDKESNMCFWEQAGVWDLNLWFFKDG